VRLGLFITTAAALVALSASCKHSSDTSSVDTTVTCAPTPPGTKQGDACDAAVELPPLQERASNHAPEGTPLTYCSNPPSSGTHYPVWAQFTEYDHIVPAPYLVHDLEHGAVILYWKCTPAAGGSDGGADAGGTPACTPPAADVLAALRKVRDDTPTDSLCDADTRVRIIIAPSADIETPIAAAAWGVTYHASCVDVPSLEAFVRDHYGQGPEQLCVPGELL
jgi:hypothetical protein